MKPGESAMQRKRIAVSQKRQITIPVDFYNEIGIENEVECYVRDNAIVIRPVHDDGGAFAEEILGDLIAQGLSGDELLSKFKATRRQVRPAVEEMLTEAELAANGKAPFSTYEDVFGREEHE
jgi:bifunctional DNA-binding transcriptional regulator/antitoxin component of YhaV-PrlF toxin-antitoxin module